MALHPRPTYTFKHALVQDAAYQGLLKSKRQQLHARIANVLQERFPDLAEQRPEELAHHFTEAGLTESGIGYWHKAGQQAADRSANLEAIAQLTKALELLKALPESRARDENEAAVQITLGVPLIAVKGYGGLEVQEAYGRALELCRKTGNTAVLFPVLRGLWNWHLLRSHMETASRLGTQLLDLAQSQQDADAWPPPTGLSGRLCFSRATSAKRNSSWNTASSITMASDIVRTRRSTARIPVSFASSTPPGAWTSLAIARKRYGRWPTLSLARASLHIH